MTVASALRSRSMGARAAAIVAGIAVVIWSYTHFTTDGPVPSADVLVALADEEWRPGFCYEYKWPCLVVTDIRLDRASVDWEPRDKGEKYRACFDIDVQFETTQWDFAQGVPAEPRTYMEGQAPLHQCANVHFFMGEENDPRSWTFIPIGDHWGDEPTKVLRDALCAYEPSWAAYHCP